MGKMAAWWSSLGFGRLGRAPEHDYADMGTAFGLDASMDTVPSAYNPPSSGHPEAQAFLSPSERGWFSSR
jgi:hypothetical protein